VVVIVLLGLLVMVFVGGIICVVLCMILSIKLPKTSRHEDLLHLVVFSICVFLAKKTYKSIRLKIRSEYANIDDFLLKKIYRQLNRIIGLDYCWQELSISVDFKPDEPDKPDEPHFCMIEKFEPNDNDLLIYKMYTLKMNITDRLKFKKPEFLTKVKLSLEDF